MSRLAALLLCVGLAGCRSPVQPSPPDTSHACCWNASGVGDLVVEMPAYITRVQVSGSYPGSSSNFIIWIGPAPAACDVSIAIGCRLLVNELIGTLWGRPTYIGTLQTGGGGLVQVVKSAGVTWRLQEVR